MSANLPKLCLTCRDEIPQARKRCWECARKHAAKAAKVRSRRKRQADKTWAKIAEALA